MRTGEIPAVYGFRIQRAWIPFLLNNRIRDFNHGIAVHGYLIVNRVPGAADIVPDNGPVDPDIA